MSASFTGAPSTGGGSNSGFELKVDQASALDLLRDDTGAPMLATVSEVSSSTLFDPFSLGNEEEVDQQPTEPSPTLFITIDYPFGGQRRKVRVPWTNGLTLKHAWHIARHNEPFFRHIGVKKYAKYVNTRKIRLTSTLNVNDVVWLKLGAV